MNKIAPITPEQASDRTGTKPMQLYFRHRHNGAFVFRMEVANRQRRIELNQIATVTKTGEILPHKRRTPTETELAEITTWWQNWQARADADELTESEKFLVDLNKFTDWVQRKAEPAEIDSQSDAALMALLDLRQVIVRRLADIAKLEELEGVSDDDDTPADARAEEPPRRSAEG